MYKHFQEILFKHTLFLDQYFTLISLTPLFIKAYTPCEFRSKGISLFDIRSPHPTCFTLFFHLSLCFGHFQSTYRKLQTTFAALVFHWNESVAQTCIQSFCFCFCFFASTHQHSHVSFCLIELLKNIHFWLVTETQYHLC